MDSRRRSLWVSSLVAVVCSAVLVLAVGFLMVRTGLGAGFLVANGHGGQDRRGASVQAEDPRSAYYVNFSDGRRSSQYHVVAKDIDWDRPVGVVFYFDGDSEGKSSPFYDPYGQQMQSMARSANSRNMVFVPVMSPDRDAPDGHITWWEDQRNNGSYFRALAHEVIQVEGLDNHRVWLAGYSGGAEFITYELLARHSGWIKGGGATIIGGGDADGMLTRPSAAVKNMSLTWHEGTDDVPDTTSDAEEGEPPGEDEDQWSGSTAGESGIEKYREAGFTHTSMDTLAGVDHGGYDLPALLEKDLSASPGL